jgi:hypothetical protein
VESPRPVGHLLSDEPLPFGKLVLGQADYGEFACSKSTAAWLMGGGMTHLDGKEVQLRVKDECVGGHNVWLGLWTQDEA